MTATSAGPCDSPAVSHRTTAAVCHEAGLLPVISATAGLDALGERPGR